MKWGWIILGLFGTILGLQVQAQHRAIPLNHTFRWEYEHYLDGVDSIRHRGYRPLFLTWDQERAYRDSLQARYPRKQRTSWVGRKIWQEHLIRLEKEDVGLFIDPLFNFQGGLDVADTSNDLLSTNTRGIQLGGYITPKVSFYTSFYENQSFFPSYLKQYVDSTEVVPGQGKIKEFGDGGFDYNMATGYVRVQVTRQFDFQFGHDKLFIGHGYRSLLLSDNAFNYPYLRLGGQFWKGKIQYNTAYASLQTLDEVPRLGENEAMFIRKAANFHYLSISPIPSLEIGLFEGVIWDRWDDSTGTRSLEPGFFVPVIFANTLFENDLGRSVIGLNLRYALADHYHLYGQLGATRDDFGGYQVGFRGTDLLGVQGLHAQLEWNQTEADFYGVADSYTNYTHYNQQLAFVNGSEVQEWIGSVHYMWRYAFVNARMNWIDSDINRTLYNVEAGYLINPSYNLNIYGGAQLRTGDVPETQWLYLGLRTSLTNAYYDF